MICGKYKIESDTLNVTISKPVKKKSGEIRWQPTWYFSSLENALNWLVRLGVRETNMADLKTVIHEIHRVEREIKDALNHYQNDSVRVHGASKCKKGELVRTT